MIRPSWNEYFMAIAKIVSTRSTCSSRRNGCIIVRDKQILSTGYNGSIPGDEHCNEKTMPDGSKYCARRALNVPDIDKYNFCVGSHAENNAICQAGKLGISLNHSIAYCTLFPCYNCLKSLKIAGIDEVYYEYLYESNNKERDNYWIEQLNKSGIIAHQIQLSDNTIKIVNESLKYPTAKRLLNATD